MNLKKWILFAVLFSFSISPLHANNFLTVSDIHFDPFSSCENKTPRPVIDALNQAPPNQWAEILTDELAKTFPNTDVYMAVGNNNSYNNNLSHRTQQSFSFRISFAASLFSK